METIKAVYFSVVELAEAGHNSKLLWVSLLSLHEESEAIRVFGEVAVVVYLSIFTCLLVREIKRHYKDHRWE